jgi:hypothetical protein
MTARRTRPTLLAWIGAPLFLWAGAALLLPGCFLDSSGTAHPPGFNSRCFVHVDGAEHGQLVIDDWGGWGPDAPADAGNLTSVFSGTAWGLDELAVSSGGDVWVFTGTVTDEVTDAGGTTSTTSVDTESSDGETTRMVGTYREPDAGTPSFRLAVVDTDGHPSEVRRVDLRAVGCSID